MDITILCTQSHPATPSQKKRIIPHTHPERNFIRSHPARKRFHKVTPSQKKILMVHTHPKKVF